MRGGFGTSPPPAPTVPLYVYNAGFLTQKRVRRILTLAGFSPRIGLPRAGGLVGVWGDSPTSHRGHRVAGRCDADLLRVEDAFLRSALPGRAGEPPAGLLLDRQGLHFDASTPSALEMMLAGAPLDDTALLDRARAVIARIRDARLGKYHDFDPHLPLPDPGYVLVVDQVSGDASVRASGGNRARFLEMLVIAQEENPGAQVLIRTHPETSAGFRAGHFRPSDATGRITLVTGPVDPWGLLDGAIAVYTHSSQMGFDAILAGHVPRVFGQPFYAGWGLTRDEDPVARRTRQLTRAQLVACAMIEYPTWYDPFSDSLCQVEQVLDRLEAQAIANRQDRAGWTAGGMRLWKRATIRKFFGQRGRLSFTDVPDPDDPRPHMAWASRADPEAVGITRIEDGFLRSAGLGAALVPPLSLVGDDLGIYYDPARPSRLEALIARRESLSADRENRAKAVIAALTDGGLSKYNLGGPPPKIPQGHVVLVPGQVEDDASVLRGAGSVRRNRDLLRVVRKARPDAVIVYKPHPDVEAGLRKGAIPPDMLADLADVVAPACDPAALLACCDEVWTMTSLLGFEALLRTIPVTTLGAPFYAGWGLTHDLGDPPARRTSRPTLEGLVHACLIDYPRYRDPVSGQICPVEVIIALLRNGTVPGSGPANRTLSKLQGLLASRSDLWR